MTSTAKSGGSFGVLLPIYTAHQDVRMESPKFILPFIWNDGFGLPSSIITLDRVLYESNTEGQFQLAQNQLIKNQLIDSPMTSVETDILLTVRHPINRKAVFDQRLTSVLLSINERRRGKLPVIALWKLNDPLVINSETVIWKTRRVEKLFACFNVLADSAHLMCKLTQLECYLTVLLFRTRVLNKNPFMQIGHVVRMAGLVGRKNVTAAMSRAILEHQDMLPLIFNLMCLDRIWFVSLVENAISQSMRKFAFKNQNHQQTSVFTDKPILHTPEQRKRHLKFPKIA